MSTTSNRILSVYKSRKTILELLSYQDYNVNEYNEFSINEIDAMHSNDQLDMLISHNKKNKKVFSPIGARHLGVSLTTSLRRVP